MPNLTVEDVPTADLRPFHKNPRRGNIPVIAESLSVNGQYKPIVVNRGTHTGRRNEILAGNHTYAAALTLGWQSIEATFVDVDDAGATRIVAADNRSSDLGAYDDELLAELLEGLAGLEGTGYTDDDLAALLSEPEAPPEVVRLADRFGAPPLSVLSGRGGEWTARKRLWTSLGIRSELGRDGELVFDTPQTKYINWYDVKNAAVAEAGRALTDTEVLASPRARDLRTFNASGGTSVFDPTLTELIYSWYSAPGMQVIDPWAGGSVRGVVASVLGRQYTGIELRPEQVEANREQLRVIAAAVQAGIGVGGEEPRWLSAETVGTALDALPADSADLVFTAPPKYVVGESTEELRGLDAASYDLAFGCPPYYNLEKYSDDPRDLSNLSKAAFDEQMRLNIAALARVLREDSFAVFVVGSIRDRHGYVLDMRVCMSAACEAAGLRLINDAVLLTPLGTVPQHAARSFRGARTLSRVHQEVLVYVKGDRKRAAERCGEVEPLALAAVEVGEDDG